MHKARNGGSLTSSIGAKSNGKSGSSMLSIFTKRIILGAKLQLLSIFIKK
ncbi:hypothetical protein JCM19301_3898 [Jejuia pallidilutea]|uniref:Uncharacterized protein n=1 Tax=Jejuia pallidilutea TaxID=504487 RepID=A0A090VN56_9FLAO|nr:hypothetical protein JCM19301_3898 [Jejuia pallidilutea]